MKRTVTVICVMNLVSGLITGTSADTAEELRVLRATEEGLTPDEMLRAYLRSLTSKAFERREKAYERIKTPGDIAAYQQRMRDFFVEQLGGWPDRTQLNARIVGRIKRDGYRIEKIIYESQPDFYVTAILYLPDSNPPYPAVLLLCGHAENGKAHESYQRVCILLAKNGIAALCPDPIGQGERKQIVDSEQTYRATAEHMLAGVAPILLGRNLATYMIWDAIRAIDYLVSRPDIDSSRIGCAGNSGGGNRTSYLVALDDRVACAAPGCFITTTRRKNENPGPGDAEQNIHRQITFGLDHADYLLIRAPKPILICAATRDFVPIEGTWEAFREAKRFFTRLGYPERVNLVETDAVHGFSTHLRVGTVRWMRRWLLRKDDAITESRFPVLSEKDLQCTPDGQVLRMEGARSIFDLYFELERRLAKERTKLRTVSSKAETLSTIRTITGVRRLAELPRPEVEPRGNLQRKGYRIDRLVLRPRDGIPLPALLFVPDAQDGSPYLYLHGEGKHADAFPGGPIERLVQAGNLVLAVDLRGCGETRSRNWRYGEVTRLLGGNLPEFFVAYMLGRSLLGMRTEDILIAARFLGERASEESESAKVHLVAIGEAGPPALHAAALEQDLFASLTLRRVLASWSQEISSPVPRVRLSNVVHGALKVYDLPDLIEMFGTERVTIE